MGILEAITSFFTNYTNFHGRSRRSAFWWICLVNFIVGLIPIVNYIWGIAILIPSIAICVRRLHDIGKSGWWYLLGLVPIVGWIILIIWFIRDSQPGDNQWGPNPKGINAAE